MTALTAFLLYEVNRIHIWLLSRVKQPGERAAADQCTVDFETRKNYNG